MTSKPSVNPTDSNNTTISSTTLPFPPTSKIGGYRLSKDVRPTVYKLQMKVYLPGFGTQFPPEKNYLVEGHVWITVDVLKSVDYIELNYIQPDINIIKANLRNFDVERSWKNEHQMAEEALMVSYNKTSEKGAFSLSHDKKIMPGTYVLEIHYKGKVLDSLAGLYKSTYTTNNGTTRTIATTQMEPTDARRMVPCFDEPEFKAVWYLEVIHPKGTIATSNSPIIKSSVFDPKIGTIAERDWSRTEFAATPNMSSYLLALVIHDFEEIQNKTSNRLFRIWARKEKKNQLQYALDFGVKCIEFFEELFGIPFPLEKMDMMAIPDFSAGAMENWGLITYRERALLLDDSDTYNRSTYAQRRRVSTIIAHELAHQWFGNLVTMSWWDDLWLNEGFATYIAFVAVEKIAPELHSFDYFTCEQQGAALREDVIGSVEPIHYDAETPEDALAGFNAITYSKGGSILHMLEETLGKKTFYEGLRRYLKANQFKNAKTADLWKHLQEAAESSKLQGNPFGKNSFATMADEWTRHMGYPIIHVKSIEGATGKYSLTQERYYLGDPEKMNKKYNDSLDFQWTVPLFVRTTKGQRIDETLEILGKNSLKPKVIASDTVPVVNFDAQSLIRVNYDRKGWESIRQQIDKIPPKGQIRHYDDVFWAAKAGHLDNYSVALDFVDDLKRGDIFPLAKMTLLENLLWVWSSVMENENATKVLRAYVGKKHLTVSDFETHLTLLSHNDAFLENNKTMETQVEVAFLQAECLLWPEECGKKTREAFTKWTTECQGQPKPKASNCSKIPQLFRKFIYCEAVRSESVNEKSVFKMIKELYKNENDQIESNNLLAALTCTQDWEAIEELLNATIHKTGDIRLQDIIYFAQPLVDNRKHSAKLLPFLEANFKTAEESLGKESRKELNEIITLGLSKISSAADQKRVEAIRESADSKTKKSTVWDKAFENYWIREHWKNNYEKGVLQWFKEKARKTINFLSQSSSREYDSPNHLYLHV